MKYELLIEQSHGSGIWHKPAVIEPVEWTTHRKESPSTLTFKVIKDDKLSFQEGARVSFKVDGVGVFLGYVFQKSRDKDQHIEVTAYDQLRYFKNKNAYLFENIKANVFVKRVCDDFLLVAGELEDTGYAIKSICKTNDTLFDMIQYCVDETVMNTGRLYCIYDDFGKITLKNIANMKVNYVVKDDTAENFDYSSSIDSNTYNRIKIQKADEESGLADIIISQDSKSIKQWGVLQQFETWGEDANKAQVQAKADNMLKLHNAKTRSLGVSGCTGDIRVRGGTSVIVQLALGDIPKLNNYMLVEEATHTFGENMHTMDLTLKGCGDFYG